MLTCACVADPEETAIVRACLLHEQWAQRAVGMRMPSVDTGGLQAKHMLRAAEPLDAYGPPAGGKGKVTR